VADQGMPKAGDVIAGKYRIEQLIGVGGMGAVFAATHQYTGKRVAVKWMLPELAKDNDAVQRFLREAHAAGRINHPNVVDVYDVGQHDTSYFLVMEFLQGEPLTTALARRDLTATEVLALLLPAMRGVAAAHRQGVVHRDLKPDNIFLAYEEDGVRREAKVLDFGISKVTNDGPADMRLTRTGAVVGTPYYMSPEQIRGSAGLDRRADVYAFGVILYEALTGRVPFHADTYGALVLEIATGTPKSPDELCPGLPIELARIVLRSMARDMNERYPSMESLVAALEPFVNPGTARVDLRSRKSLGGVGLESTRVSSEQQIMNQYPPAHGQVETKPRLASTPFAAELPERQARPIMGLAAFVGAAVAIVAGVWFFTREAEPAKGAASGTPIVTTPIVTPPRATTPVPTPEPENPVPSEAPLPTVTTQPIGQPGQPASIPAGSMPGGRPDPYTFGNNNQFRQPSAAGPEDGNRGWRQRRRGQQQGHGARATPSAPVPDEAGGPTESQPARRARSGSLNVNEF
jgi:serine/threonine protein kinase